SALIEALAFGLAEKNAGPVMEAFRTSLGITDKDTARSNLSELLPKPYPSRTALESMQRVMSMHDVRVRDIKVDQLIDARLVKKLDDEGVIEHLHQIKSRD